MSELGENSPNPWPRLCCHTPRRAHKHDTGWAWVVAASGSLCTVLAIGCSYSFGVIYPALLDEFAKGKAQTGKRRVSVATGKKKLISYLVSSVSLIDGCFVNH